MKKWIWWKGISISLSIWERHPDHLSLESFAKPPPKAKMVELTRPISWTMPLPVPVTPCLLPWKPPSSSISLVGESHHRDWPSSILHNSWIRDGGLLMKNSERQNPAQSLWLRGFCILRTTLFKEVRYHRTVFSFLCLIYSSTGIAGAFGATIVYPIDMGKSSNLQNIAKAHCNFF